MSRFNIHSQTDSCRYFTQHITQNTITNSEQIEIIDENKILAESGVSIINYATELILPIPTKNEHIIKEILLLNTRIFPIILHFNKKDRILLNSENNYYKFLYYKGEWIKIE